MSLLHLLYSAFSRTPAPTPPISASDAARTLGQAAQAKRRAARAAYVKAHCAALLASYHAEQREVF